MKASSELLIYAIVGIALGIFVMNDPLGKVLIGFMSFVCILAVQICRAIERNGREK